MKSNSLGSEDWLRALQCGELHLEAAFPGFSTFDGNWAHRNRTVDAAVLYLVVSGRIRTHIGERSFDIEKGGLLLMGPGVRHDFTLADKNDRLTLYHLRLHASKQGSPCWLEDEILLRPHQDALRIYFERIIEDFARDVPWRSERLNALFLLIFTEVFAARERPDGGLTGSQQARLTRRMRDHPAEKITPAGLAATLGLSLDYFSRRFKATYGMIPRAWIVRERLRLGALKLVESDLSIAAIAERLGYENTFLFTRQFTKEHGCSPREFRGRHR